MAMKKGTDVRKLAAKTVKHHLIRTRRLDLSTYAQMVIAESSYMELYVAAAGEPEGIIQGAEELRSAAAQL